MPLREDDIDDERPTQPPVGRVNRPVPLALTPENASPQPLSLAERGAAAEREFAALEAARKRAQRDMRSPPAGAPRDWNARAGSPSHRTPRSAFDSRLAERAASAVSQRSHRTPREANTQNQFEPHLSKVLQYGGNRALQLSRKPLTPYLPPP
jgi:hypothetical protein